MFAVVLFTVGILLILSELGCSAQGLGWGSHQEKPWLIPTLMVFLSPCRQEVQVQFSPEAQVSEMLCCTALGAHATGSTFLCVPCMLQPVPAALTVLFSLQSSGG